MKILKLSILNVLVFSESALANPSYTTNSDKVTVVNTVSINQDNTLRPPSCDVGPVRKPLCSLRTRSEGHFTIYTVFINHSLFGEFDSYDSAITGIRRLRSDLLCL